MNVLRNKWEGQSTAIAAALIVSNVGDLCYLGKNTISYDQYLKQELYF